MRTWFTSLLPGVVAVLGAACSSDHGTSPRLAACVAGVGTPIALSVGAYIAVDPAGDSGCVRFAANTGVDSIEYLLVPQSAALVPGEVSPFQLTGGAITAAAATALATRA